MKRLLLWGGLAVVATIGIVAFGSRRRRLGENDRVLLVGDSLAVGLSVPMRKLAADAGIPFDSVAHSGSRLDQWSKTTGYGAQLIQKLATFRPTVVLISLGTNDSYMVAPKAIAAVAGHLATIMQRIAGAEARLYWIGPPTLPKPDNGAVATIRSAIPRFQYFDSAQLTIPRQPDGIHPTWKGYAFWAEQIWGWLSK